MARSFAILTLAVPLTCLVVACGDRTNTLPHLRGSGDAGDGMEEPVTDGEGDGPMDPDTPADGGSNASEDAATMTTPKDAGHSSNDSGTATVDSGGPLSADESGEATYYDADGTGSCGFPATTNYYITALNDEEYKSSSCGKCVEVTGPNGTVTVRIVDKCPGCGPGDLDLSMTAFKKIASLSAGRVPITWHYVTCP